MGGYLSSRPERPFSIFLGSSHHDPDLYETLGAEDSVVEWMAVCLIGVRPVSKPIDLVLELMMVWLVEVARVGSVVGKVAGP